MRNNEDREQEANSEDVGNVRQTNDDDATHDGRPKGSTKAMSRDNEQHIARAIAETSS